MGSILAARSARKKPNSTPSRGGLGTMQSEYLGTTTHVLTRKSGVQHALSGNDAAVALDIMLPDLNRG